MLPTVDDVSRQQDHVREPHAAIVVDRLIKRFESRPVLRGVSFALAAGKTLALFGANGAGKTTLLRVLATLTKPTAGTVLVEGRDTAYEAEDVRRLIGYVGHQPHVYPELTARENLHFFARMYGLRDGPERTERLLTRMALRAKGNDRARTLSRGQTQRLALARGILTDPVVLLLDEPDTGLDEEATALLAELVDERREVGFTTLLTTHSVERGLALADEVIVLGGGRVLYEGSAQAVDVAHVRTLYRQHGGAGR
jgi:heme ABC exporter ATP-binding subunit CcmA